MNKMFAMKSASLRAVAGFVLVALLSACGGGGGSAGDPLVGGGGSTGGGGGTAPSTLVDLALTANKTTVPNSGAETVTVTVTALKAGNAALIGATTPVTLKVSSGAVVTATSSSTSASDGTLTATVSLVDKASRTVEVTASSGTIEKKISFDVVESNVVVTKASDLSMSLSKNSIGNSGSETVDVSVVAVDGARNVLSGVTVKFTVDSNGVLVPVNELTGSDGVAKAKVSIGADYANRTITVTATSGTLVRRASFRVTGAKLQATLQPATLKVGERGTVEYTLTDVNSNAMPDVAVSVAGPGTSSGNGTTDSRGKFVYSYTATGSGPSIINATSGGATSSSTVQVDAALAVVPAGTTIASATFTASPLVVNVNPVGSKDNRAELRLLFLTDNNVPVPNVRARIGFGANAAGTDADISSGKDAVITSDANGLAITSFIAGQRASSTDQVKVFACFAKDDSVEQVTACPAERLRTISLTVVEQPVSISIGTNGLVATGSNGATYIQEFTVLVVDQAGAPKADVQLAPVIDLVTYRKGFFTYVKANSQWERTQTAECINEDKSSIGYRNNTIEPSEDVNNNGQLDPRKSDAAISMVGSTRTDANGLALLRVEYPQSMGTWVEFSIRVSASGVVSPPAWTGRLAKVGDTVTSLQGIERKLIVPISVIKSEATPPFELSPYGQSSSCTDAN